MANAYYNSAGKEVVDGDIAYADDLNAINTAVNAGLNLVETDIQTIETNQPYYTNLAQKWATEIEDTQVTTGKYSSLHYAAKASASATTTSGYTSTAITKAGEASASAVSAAGSAGTATTKAGEASASAISASSSAGTATTKAGEASDSAIAAAASASSIVRDGSGGVAGLTLFKLNMKNVLGTFISYFTNSNTASRIYTLPDKDGTIVTTDDVVLKSGGSFTGSVSTTKSFRTSAPVTTNQSTYIVLDTDTYLIFLCQTSTITLPDPATNVGRPLHFKQISVTTPKTLTATQAIVKGMAIQQSATTNIMSDVNSCTLVSDGNYWVTMNYNNQ